MPTNPNPFVNVFSGRRLLLPALLPLLCACQPEADSSDVESLSESIAAMSEAHNPEEQDRLRRALYILALTETGYLGEIPDSPVAVAADATLGPALMRVLDGDTFDDIIEKATAVRETELKQAIQLAQRAQQDVQARMAQANAEISQLRDVDVGAARYGWSKGDYMPQAFVEFTLDNQSDEALTGVKMRSTLTTPERDEPWLFDVLAHELVRPQAARSSEKYRLVPNQFSAWGNRALQNRRDVRLKLELINVRIGSEWRVSADPLALEKELRHYQQAEQSAKTDLATLQSAGHI
jgi:hypothetical protein